MSGDCAPCDWSTCSVGNFLTNCSGVNHGSCTSCTSLPSNAHFTSKGSRSGLDDCTWSCDVGYTRSGNTCFKDCAAGSPHGSTQSIVRYETQHVPSGSTCQSQTRTRDCQDGSFTAWSGTFEALQCHVSCTQDGLKHGEASNRTMFMARSVPAGSVCNAQAQFKMCSQGIMATSWSGDHATYIYDKCDEECSPGCGFDKRGDGHVHLECNVKACCFDGGDISRHLADQLLKARYESFAGNSIMAKNISNVLCAYPLNETDVSQTEMVQLGCAQRAFLEQGMDIFGKRYNHVTHLQYSDYDKLVDLDLEVIESIDEEIDQARQKLQSLQVMMHSKSLADGQIAELKQLQSNVVQLVKSRFDKLDTATSVMTASLKTQKHLMDETVRSMRLLHESIQQNQMMLITQEGLILRNGELQFEYGTKMLDAIQSTSLNILEEHSNGNLRIFSRLDDVSDKLEDITDSISNLTDITFDGFNMIAKHVTSEGEKTRKVVRFEANLTRSHVSQEAQNTRRNITIGLKVMGNKITGEIAKLSDAQRQKIEYVQDQLQLNQGRMDLVSTVLGTTNGYDLNGDGTFSVEEFARFLMDTGRFALAAESIIDDFISSSEDVSLQYPEAFLSGGSRKLLARKKGQRKGFSTRSKSTLKKSRKRKKKESDADVDVEIDFGTCSDEALKVFDAILDDEVCITSDMQKKWPRIDLNQRRLSP